MASLKKKMKKSKAKKDAVKKAPAAAKKWNFKGSDKI